MAEPGRSPGINEGRRKYGDQEAKRIMKILLQISENLSKKNGIIMRAVLTQIILSAKGDSSELFIENVRKFVRIIIFNPGISVNLLKQAVRSFKMIRKQPDLGDMVYEKISRLVSEEFPSLARMGKIDDETLRIYVSALETGIEKVRHIRLMVVGMYGVGKSCLVRKLCNRTIHDVKTTVGVDVLMDACEVNDKGMWIPKRPSEGKQKGYDKRLNMIMSEAKVERPVYEGQLPLSGLEIDPRPTSHSPMEGVLPSQENPNMKVDIAKKALNDIAAHNKPGFDEYVNNIANFHEGDDNSLDMLERKTSVSIWDFAGQSVYYSTHHFFLSSRSIYLLVMNLSKSLDDMVSENKSGEESDKYNEDLLLEGCMPEGFTCRDAFRFWINSIYTYTKGDTKGCNIEGKPYHPKIVLVGTHKDLLEGTEKMKDRKKDEYFRDALEQFEDTPIYELIHHEKFLVSCTKDVPAVFERIKESINEIAMQQPFWDEPVPAKWIPLERSTEETKMKGDRYMRLEDLIEVDATTEFPLKDKKNIQLFLAFQHFLGNLLYYNVGRLSETIILSPQWLVDGFKLFVTHQPSINNKKVEKAWQEYQRQAKLKPELIDHIIEQSDDQNGENNFKKYREELIEYLQHLDVIAKPVTYSTDETSCDQDFFIVPCLLKKLTTNEAENLKHFFQPKEDKAKTTPVLCFVFKDSFLPPAVFHRLLATCIRRFETATQKTKKNYVLYNGMGVFKLDCKRTLIIWYAEFVIFMRIAIFPAEEKLRSEDCQAVKEEISKMLKKILLLDKQKRPANASLQEDFVLYNEYILCEEKLEQSVEVLFKDKEMNGLLAVHDLKEKGSLVCECKEHHGVTKEVALNYWYLSPDEPSDSWEMWFEEVEKEKGSLDNGPSEDSELAEIAEFIGKEYWSLGLKLGLSESDLERIQEENQFNVLRRIICILIKWKNRSDNPTYTELRTKIKEAKGKR